jgi:hypothetical protein
MLEALGGAVLSAQLGHDLAVEQPGNETQAFFHDRTFPSRASPPPLLSQLESVTHVSGTICHLCLGSLTYLVSVYLSGDLGARASR